MPDLTVTMTTMLENGWREELIEHVDGRVILEGQCPTCMGRLEPRDRGVIEAPSVGWCDTCRVGWQCRTVSDHVIEIYMDHGL